MSAQRRTVTDKPQVAEWIDESTLAMYPLRNLVVANLVDGAVYTDRSCPLNESVGVVDE